MERAGRGGRARAALEPHQQSDSITHAIDCRRRTTTPRGRQPTDPTASFVSAHREFFKRRGAGARKRDQSPPANLAAQQAIAVLTAEGLDPFAALPPFGERSDPSRRQLHWAASRGRRHRRPESREHYCVRARRDRARCALGNTALHLAAAQCSPSCVDTLLARPETRAPQAASAKPRGTHSPEVAANRQASCPPLSELWRRARSTLRRSTASLSEDLPDAHHAAKPSKRAIISTAAESESRRRTARQERDNSLGERPLSPSFSRTDRGGRGCLAEARAGGERRGAPSFHGGRAGASRLRCRRRERWASTHRRRRSQHRARSRSTLGCSSPPPLKSPPSRRRPRRERRANRLQGRRGVCRRKGRCHGPLRRPWAAKFLGACSIHVPARCRELMLSAGVNPAVVLPPGSLRGSKEKSLREEDRRTALHWAAAAGDVNRRQVAPSFR